MTKAFIDTNVLVYANDQRDSAKQNTALALLADGVGTGVISSQCLVEYGAVALRKLHQPAAVIDEQIAFFVASFEVVALTPELISGAVRLALNQAIN